MTPQHAIQINGLTPHFMLVPSLACPSECSYCFGPHRGPIMSPETMDAALEFMARIIAETGQRKVKVTFHGGEPLMAQSILWRKAFEGIITLSNSRKCDLALQSNLWLLTDGFCNLFRTYNVEIGTSLDGPKEITDAQRGQGYFARTIQGIRKAQAHGLRVGCIATFTTRNLPHWREIFDFFQQTGLSFSIHAAVPQLYRNSRSKETDVSLSPAQYGTLLRHMLDYYIEHRHEIAVSSLDQICRGFGCGEGKVCAFRDCLGMFLAIDPKGDIYPCQRFCGGQPQHRLGTVYERPVLTNLLSSPMAQRMANRQSQVRQACNGCTHLDYCLGGCPYNAWADNHENLVRDPYCEAYREVFDYIHQRARQEIAAEENINAVAERPWDGHDHPLLRKGPLIELLREGPHPSHVARTAKRIIAAVELAKGPDIPTVGTRLVQMGICRTQQSSEASLNHLWQQLHPEKAILDNLYLHVTFNCQFHCTHCYACAGEAEPSRSSQGHEAERIPTAAYHGPPPPPSRVATTLLPSAATAEMPIPTLEKLIREAKECGFRQVIITGGEPLIHSQRESMLDMLTKARTWTAPMNLVLRTNFALPFDNADLRRIASAFDKVVASVDGGKQTHDARRGLGAYAATVRNLTAYVALRMDSFASPRGDGRWGGDHLSAAELSLACVLHAADIQSGASVRQLANRLGIRAIRVRPLLPLGRAREGNHSHECEGLRPPPDPIEIIKNGFYPIATCGLGQKISIEPSGESFACYACERTSSFLGMATSNGLIAILQSKPFLRFVRHTVDSNRKCRHCELRYLCGGPCLAWSGEACQRDPDAPPPSCHGLEHQAKALFDAALTLMTVWRHHNTKEEQPASPLQARTVQVTNRL